MKDGKKNKVEDIFPLSFLQNALLFHHIYETDDQGVIQVACVLHGRIDTSRFEQAWQQTVQRHQALRSSIHWEGMEKPVQVVRPTAALELNYKDWRTLDASEQQAAFKAYREEEMQQRLTLTQASANRVALCQLSANSYQLLWVSHHILLDGWSSQVVLNDVFAYYDGLVKEQPVALPSLPTYRNYQQCLRQQDIKPAQLFWRERLREMGPPQLLEASSAATHTAATFMTINRTLSMDTYQGLQQQLRQLRTTANTFAQAIWGLLLSKYFAAETALFGTTVAGRNVDLPNVDKMAGLFTNVLPVSITIPAAEGLATWLQTIQQANLAASTHEHYSLEQIMQWATGKTDYSPFNSLFLTQNHSWDALGNDSIQVSDYEGDMTTTYPLTMIVVPKEEFTIHLRFKAAVLPPVVAQWFMDQYLQLIAAVVGQPSITTTQLSSMITAPPAETIAELTEEQAVANYQPPRNKTELELVKIWEDILQTTTIGVEDDFFLLGGTSLLAVRLFQRLKDTFGLNLPPITLVKNRTIASLSPLLTDEQLVPQWETIIPLKAGGKAIPIFCLHAGQGNVFFYEAFAKAVQRHPVYAIQPRGLDGEEEQHQSIEEMAAHYVAEILQLYPQGECHLIGTCFSNPIVLEMGRLLHAQGHPLPTVTIVDSAPKAHTLDGTYVTPTHRPLGFYYANLRKRQWRNIREELEIRFMPTNWAGEHAKEHKTIRRFNDKFGPVIDRHVWSAYPGNMLFIRSSENVALQSKDRHLPIWQQLIEGTLTVEVVEAAHLRIFKDTAAQQMAQCVERYLLEAPVRQV